MLSNLFSPLSVIKHRSEINGEYHNPNSNNPFYSLRGGPLVLGSPRRLGQNPRLAKGGDPIGSGGGSSAGKKAPKISRNPKPAGLRGKAGWALLGKIPIQASSGQGLLQCKPRQSGTKTSKVKGQAVSSRTQTRTESGQLSTTGCVGPPRKASGPVYCSQFKSSPKIWRRSY